MIYIFVMSVGGSLLLLFYCLTNNKKLELFFYKQQDILLKGSLFFYLVPLLPLAYLYEGILNCLPFGSRRNASGVIKHTYFYAEVDGKNVYNMAYQWQLRVLGVWFLVALIILCVRIFLYTRKRNRLFSMAEQVTEGAAYELLEKVRREQKIKRRVRLYHVKETAVTMGVLRPVICCDCEESPEWLELIVQHECAHIRRWDVFTRQLLSLAKSIHWFNPLVYRLSEKAERVFEFCCDETVVNNADTEKRKAYARMLVIQTPTVQSGVPAFSSTLTKSGKEIEERIMNIMKPKTRTKLQTALAVVILSAVFFMDSWTVLAYPEAIEIEPGFSENFHADAESYFIEDGAVKPFSTFTYTFLYEKQFVDEDGTIHLLEEEISTAAFCLFHDWVSGHLQEHVVNDNGGCTVYTYTAQRCSKCGKVKVGELISSTNYTTCTH